MLNKSLLKNTCTTNRKFHFKLLMLVEAKMAKTKIITKNLNIFLSLNYNKNNIFTIESDIIINTGLSQRID